MLYLGVIASLSPFLAATPAQENPAKTDLKHLQGSWQVILFQDDGKKEPDEVLKYIKWTFKGNTLFTTKALTVTEDGKRTVKGQGGTVEETFTIDPSKKPKEMAGVTKKPFEGIETRSIYELDGDSLKVCANKDANAAVPKEFSAPPNSGRVLIILRRMK